MPDEAEARKAERKHRAAARSVRMTVEIVALAISNRPRTLPARRTRGLLLLSD
jgi:hypothetical protein